MNAVAPGPVWTPLIPMSYPAEQIPEFGKSVPMQRPAQPAELAPAYVFLASAESSYVNGEVLGVTGASSFPEVGTRSEPVTPSGGRPPPARGTAAGAGG